MYLNKEFELNDEEVDISIYNYTIDTLYKNGYHQYEISNYAKEGYECIYNIQIMEEKQSNYALGAGSISKFVYVDEDRIERVENVKNVEQYIDRVDERERKYIKMLTKAPRGTKDITPKDAYKWNYVENKFREICSLFGYEEMRTPVFEHTELFKRSVGDTTDIVQKEMYR